MTGTPMKKCSLGEIVKKLARIAGIEKRRDVYPGLPAQGLRERGEELGAGLEGPGDTDGARSPRVFTGNGTAFYAPMMGSQILIGNSDLESD